MRLPTHVVEADHVITGTIHRTEAPTVVAPADHADELQAVAVFTHASEVAGIPLFTVPVAAYSRGLVPALPHFFFLMIGRRMIATISPSTAITRKNTTKNAMIADHKASRTLLRLPLDTI